MSYKGSTELSSVANPPIKIGGGLDNRTNVGSTTTPIGTGLWFYGTTDTTTAMFGSGYFTDGYALGLKQGDIMLVSGITSTVSSSVTLYLGVVSSVSSTGGGTQLSTWSVISSTMT